MSFGIPNALQHLVQLNKRELFALVALHGFVTLRGVNSSNASAAAQMADDLLLALDVEDEE